MFIQVQYLLLLKCLRLMHLRLLLGGVTIITLILQELRCIWLWLERPILSTSKKTTCTWELKKTTLSVSVLPEEVSSYEFMFVSQGFDKTDSFYPQFPCVGSRYATKKAAFRNSIHSWIVLDPTPRPCQLHLEFVDSADYSHFPVKMESRDPPRKSPKCFTNYFPMEFLVTYWTLLPYLVCFPCPEENGRERFQWSQPSVVVPAGRWSFERIATLAASTCHRSFGYQTLFLYLLSTSYEPGDPTIHIVHSFFSKSIQKHWQIHLHGNPVWIDRHNKATKRPSLQCCKWMMKTWGT